MENTEQNNNKVQIGTKVDPEIFRTVSDFALAEDRSMSNMVERLLKTHPRVQEVLEGDTATATA